MVMRWLRWFTKAERERRAWVREQQRLIDEAIMARHAEWRARR